MPLVQQQQVQLAQRLTRNALASAEPVVERGDEHEVLVEERQFGHARHAQGHGEQQQVEPPAGQAVEQVGGLLLVHLEVEVRIPVVDEPQDGGQQVGRHGRDDPQPQHSRERRAHRLGLLHQGAHLPQHRLGPYGDPLALG